MALSWVGLQGARCYNIVMILTEEQRKELAGPLPIRAVDPETKQEYVLVPAEWYEQVRPMKADPDPSPRDLQVPAGIRRSEEAFLRDLPQMMINKKHQGWWAAYQECRRIGIDRDPWKLLERIHDLGIQEDEYYLGVIRPHELEPEEVEPRHHHHFEDASS